MFHVASGNLSFQVEHHLYPDMPSTRYAEIAPRVKEICERYGLPYNTGPFSQQLGMVQRTILRLAFPGGKPRPKPGPYQGGDGEAAPRPTAIRGAPRASRRASRAPAPSSPTTACASRFRTRADQPRRYSPARWERSTERSRRSPAPRRGSARRRRSRWPNEGAAVALGARRKDRLDELAEAINSDGGKAVALEADIGDEKQARGFVRGAAEELGRLDFLINNAGLMLLGPVEGVETEQWRRMVDVNVLGLLYCTQEAMPLIRDSGGGHIVNVSSVAGRTASFGSAVYNLTKWGVTGFSEALRQEALNSNIRVTCVEPGFVDTELQGHNEHPMVVEAIEKMREEIGKVLEAERHRARDPLRRLPARARQHQRGADPADRPAALTRIQYGRS